MSYFSRLFSLRRSSYENKFVTPFAAKRNSFLPPNIGGRTHFVWLAGYCLTAIQRVTFICRSYVLLRRRNFATGLHVINKMQNLQQTNTPVSCWLWYENLIKSHFLCGTTKDTAADTKKIKQQNLIFAPKTIHKAMYAIPYTYTSKYIYSIHVYSGR